MKELWKLMMVAMIAVTLGACSSSSDSGDEFGDEEFDEIPTADAGTDAVPFEDGEFQEGASDGSSFTQDSFASTPVEGSGQFDQYTVQKGDTLMKIAFEYYGDLYQWIKIYNANQAVIPDPNNLVAGTTIQVERPAVPVTVEKNGEAYLIKLGDTLGTISQDVYGTKTKWKRLWENNRQMIRDPNKIYAGFYLYYVLTPEDSQDRNSMGGGQPLAGAGGSAPADPGMDDMGMGGDDGFSDAGWEEADSGGQRNPSGQ